MYRTAVLALAVLAVPVVAAQEPAETQQSRAERAAETAPGPWQGRWQVRRIDPRLHTRAASEALLLEVIDDPVATRIDLQWLAGRAICEAPLKNPCEWVGASGQASQVVADAGGLLAVLSVSADAADPWVLWLPAPPAAGWLINALGGIRYRIEAESFSSP